MYLLNEHNEPVDLNLIPETCDMHFFVYDNTHDMKDYVCTPLIMLESFYSPTIRLKLTLDNALKTSYYINLPSDYQILIGEPTHGDLEVNDITSLSGRPFRAFAMNPVSSFRPEYPNIEIVEVLPTIRWYTPKMRPGQLLCVPLENTKKPLCIYITREMPKALDIVSIGDAM